MTQRGNAHVGCEDFRKTLRPDRRSFLKAGMLGATGLSLSQLLRLEAQAAPGHRRERKPSVIILWMRGGPSHIDMWDPKPDAPAEYRGEFGVMNTKVPGILLTDMLPMSARIMDKWSIVRSLHHHDAGHSTGDQICFTGYNAGPNPDENIYPSCGSIVVQAARPLDAAAAGLRDDPADAARRRLRLSRRGAQAVRDRRPTPPIPARSACPTSSCPRA